MRARARARVSVDRRSATRLGPRRQRPLAAQGAGQTADELNVDARQASGHYDMKGRPHRPSEVHKDLLCIRTPSTACILLSGSYNEHMHTLSAKSWY